MSQSRSILAVCALAAMVAIAASQTTVYLKCVESARDTVRDGRVKIVARLEKFSDDIQASGSKLVDRKELSKDVRELIEKINSLTTQATESFDIQKSSQTVTEAVSIYVRISTRMMNPRNIIDFGSNYVYLGLDLANLNNKLLLDLAGKCTSSGGSSSPAQ